MTINSCTVANGNYVHVRVGDYYEYYNVKMGEDKGCFSIHPAYLHSDTGESDEFDVVYVSCRDDAIDQISRVHDAMLLRCNDCATNQSIDFDLAAQGGNLMRGFVEIFPKWEYFSSQGFPDRAVIVCPIFNGDDLSSKKIWQVKCDENGYISTPRCQVFDVMDYYNVEGLNAAFDAELNLFKAELESL